MEQQVPNGRPPWFNVNLQDTGDKIAFQSSEAFLIGITGGSASGKTSVSEYLHGSYSTIE
jgi:adenylylsulfate kinase-like enzyme